MTDWRHKLEIADLHKSYQSGEITSPNLGVAVAKRLRSLIDDKHKLSPIPEELLDEADDIASEFKSGIKTIDDYDQILERLYDWGDTVLDHPDNTPFHRIPKLCWINTFG